MPLYDYECQDGHKFDRFLSLKDYKEPQTCDCGKPAKKLITPTMLNCDIQPWDSYISPASGDLITSYKDRRRDMEKTGCVDYDPGMKTDQEAAVKREDAKLDKLVDETVEKEFDAMPVRKKEKLETELKHSELEYTRN